MFRPDETYYYVTWRYCCFYFFIIIFFFNTHQTKQRRTIKPFTKTQSYLFYILLFCQMGKKLIFNENPTLFYSLLLAKYICFLIDIILLSWRISTTNYNGLNLYTVIIIFINWGPQNDLWAASRWLLHYNIRKIYKKLKYLRSFLITLNIKLVFKNHYVCTISEDLYIVIQSPPEPSI